jgi:hypothetical protein
MLMTMIRSSQAVLVRPSVANFEANERRQFGWALLYVVLGATITASLGWLAFQIQRPFIEEQNQALAAWLANLERQVGRPLPLANLFTPSNPGIPVVSNVLGTMVGFLTYLTIVFLIGRLLGGSGRFAELAYDLALFWVPVSVASALVNIFSFGLFSCLTAPLAIVVTSYGLYLTYLSVQAGMNLPPRRALILVLIPALLYVLVICVLIAVVVAAAGLEVRQVQ